MKHSTHNALALLASLLAVSLVVSALRQRRLSASPPRRAPSIRVGFVGNSFTYYNDLRSTRWRYRCRVRRGSTRGGASLASLLRTAATAPVLPPCASPRPPSRDQGADPQRALKRRPPRPRLADVATEVDVPATAQDLEAFLGDVQRDVVVVQDTRHARPIKSRWRRTSGVSTLPAAGAAAPRGARPRHALRSTWADNALTRADEDLSRHNKDGAGLAGYEEYARALQDAGVDTIAIAPSAPRSALVACAEDEARAIGIPARDGYHLRRRGRTSRPASSMGPYRPRLDRDHVGSERAWGLVLADLAGRGAQAARAAAPASSMGML